MSDILDYPIENFSLNHEAKYALYTSALTAKEDGRVTDHLDMIIFGNDLGSLEAYWERLPNWDGTKMHVIYDNQTKKMIKILSSCCGGV